MFQAEKREVEICKRVVKRCSAVLFKEKRAIDEEVDEIEKLQL